MNTRIFFHKISYLQYPLILTGVYFAYLPFFAEDGFSKENYFEAINNALIFMGLGVSFSSLQDTTKTQNKFSKNIWESPRKGKMAIIIFSIFILINLLLGVIGYFGLQDSAFKSLSIGFIVFAIGLIGLLKAAIEMFENHRLDKK